MIVSVLLLIQSYAQITLDTNEARFFIKQDVELNYLREDNKQLSKLDSVNNNIIGNYNSIISLNDSIIDNQRQSLLTYREALKASKIDIIKVDGILDKAEKKIKRRNSAIFISVIIITIETALLCIIL